jgi:predicted ATPase
LILDNCEHVRDEAAALVDIILARAPGVSILATSREPLGVAEEVVFPLGPLEFPAAAAPLAAKAIGTYAAVRLFAETARTGHPSFRLNDETAHTVAAICRKLDGIPLALKLASSGPQALRPAALLEGLSADRRPLLPAPPGMPVRHRTLEAAIAWSVALLSEAERAALRRLGVFAGSFTAADAQTVIAGDPVEPRDVPNLMSSLLKKSLLTPASANNRLRLLESTRHYALDMLANAAEAHQTRRNLARHLVGLFGRGRDVWPDSDAEIWTTAHEPDIDNLRAALDWAFAPGGDAAIGVALAARLRALFSDRLITLREYLAAIFAAIDALTPETPAEDAGWIWFSASHDLSAGMAAPVAHLARAIACFHAAANPAMAGLAGSRAAVLLIMGGDPAPARGYLAEAIATLPCVPDNRYHSAILLNAATALAMQGGDENLAAARDHFANALPLARKFRDHSQIAMLGANIAELDAVLGNYRAAIERCRLLADESRARRDWRRLSFVLSNSMNYHLLADDPLAAGEIGREAIPLLIEIADPHWATDHGGNLALIAAWAGDFRTAAILAGFSAHYYETGAKPRQTIERRIWDRLTAALDEAASAGTLPEPDRLALMDEGAALSFTEAVAIGLKICESLAQHPIKWNHLIG